MFLIGSCTGRAKVTFFHHIRNTQQAEREREDVGNSINKEDFFVVVYFFWFLLLWKPKGKLRTKTQPKCE